MFVKRELHWSVCVGGRSVGRGSRGRGRGEVGEEGGGVVGWEETPRCRTCRRAARLQFQVR